MEARWPHDKCGRLRTSCCVLGQDTLTRWGEPCDGLASQPVGGEHSLSLHGEPLGSYAELNIKPRPNDRNMPTYRNIIACVAMCRDTLGVVGWSNLS